MPKINFKPADESEEVNITLKAEENVLDALLRTGYDIPYGCRAGVCHSCIMHAKSDDIPGSAQLGLKETQKKLGYFLACCCVPEKNMDVAIAVSNNEKFKAKVLAKDYLSNTIIRLRIQKVFNYRAGQYCTLWKNHLLARCYSIASLPEDENFIEFHIKKVPGGKFSTWLDKELQIGDFIFLQAPIGDCFYTNSDDNKDLFLAGMGTGLAPLYGISRDALSNNHSGKVILIVSTKDAVNHYLVKELQQLQAQHNQLQVYFVSQIDSGSEKNIDIIQADVYDFVKSLVPDFKNQRVFLCGANSFVHKMKKQCFMAGANMTDISADAFLAFGN